MTKIRSWGAIALGVLATSVIACGSTVNPGADDQGGDSSVSIDSGVGDDAHVTDSASSDSSPSGDSISPSDTTPPIDASCDAPKKTCGDRCVDVQNDDSNCGDCGNKCSSGTVCTLGICKCPASDVICGATCVDLAVDPSHCGGCDKACASGETCVSGKCSACPSSKPTVCGASPGVCTDTSSDVDNCGACGKKCTAGASCSGGECVCPTSLVDCGSACVDLSKDASNCGGCGISCGSGSCVSGTCVCATGEIKCSGGCIDPSTDATNCGGCGIACGAGGKCLSGHCSVPKCKGSGTSVLFYGPTASLGTTSAPEQAYLPSGSTVTIAADATWKSMTTADFQKYDLIVIGEPSPGGGPASSDLQTAYDTRETWGAAINGRIAVLGMDPAYHAGMSTSGANVLLKSTLAWLSGGAPKTTSLYVSPDWGTRGLDYLGHFGAFASTPDVYINTITMLVPSHPVLTGSTDVTLSNWSSSAHEKITSYPTGFTAIANGVDDSGVFTDAGVDVPGPVIVVKDGPACAP